MVKVPTGSPIRGRKENDMVKRIILLLAFVAPPVLWLLHIMSEAGL